MPEFLFVQASDLGGEEALQNLEQEIETGGGELLAARPAADVAQLEPGTPSAAVVIARFPSAAELDRAWSDVIGDAADELAAGNADAVVALAVAGLPSEGLPDQLDVPTSASVPPIAEFTRATFMTVEGSVTDPVKIGAYRDVILPMLKRLGAYYVVFAIEEGHVRVLRGSWSEQIFAISIWPSYAAAHDEFWYSDRYQHEAIPVRRNISTFRVHLLRGVDA